MTTKNGYYNLSVWVETYYLFISVITTKNSKLVEPKSRGYDKQLLNVMRSGVGCGRNNHF